MSAVQRLTQLFPLWVGVCGMLALYQPAWFAWFSGQAIIGGLAVIMLGMGMTLRVEDFKRVWQMPRAIAAGFIAQYTIMPLAGYGVAHALALDAPFAVGLILVACCPGGTASNVVTYLARANVALSVLMTTASTLGAAVMTPLLTKMLAGTLVPVDAVGLFLSTLQVIVAPVILGVLMNRYCSRVVAKITDIAPLVSVIFITLIVASVMGQNAEAIRAAAGRLLAAVALLHALGFGLGYLFAHVLGYAAMDCRTISIEVGMQNSGLGVVLARRHFADPLTAVPCAISSIAHALIGSLLAAWWRHRAARNPS